MISFNCPQCTKAFLLANREAGQSRPCPNCGETLIVPDAAVSRRKLKIGAPLTIGAVLIVAAVILSWAWRSRRPDVIRQHFADALQAYSPSWKGIAWETCDPASDFYQVTVYYKVPGQDAYTFHVARFPWIDQTTIRVNPTLSGWLAQARFETGALDSFSYKGVVPAEKEELKTLARDLEIALSEAVR